MSNVCHPVAEKSLNQWFELPSIFGLDGRSVRVVDIAVCDGIKPGTAAISK